MNLLEVKDVLDVQARKLYLGQRIKCELVAALLHKPKVLFLDEPTIGLNVVAQKNIRDFIKKYNEQKKPQLYQTSYYMEDINQLCQRVIIVNLGEIVYDGDLRALIQKYAPYKLITITFNNEGVKKEDIEKFGESGNFNTYKASFKVSREQAKENASQILSLNLPVDDILTDEPEIDDIIRKIFRGKVK